MRSHLIGELTEIAKSDPRVIVLTADLGYGVFDRFAELFPDRYYNMGVCEQNMAAVAAGLAAEGNKVYIYSIGNFPFMRCLEQIRNCVCYHNADVTVIAVGGGFSYGYLGMTHHATEDIAMARALPNMRVFCPADPPEAEAAVRLAHRLDGPSYIRLGRNGEQRLNRRSETDFDLLKIAELKRGKKVAVVSTGPILQESLAASGRLSDSGIDVGIYSVSSIKPLDTDMISYLADQYEAIVTVEEHNVVGGLGTAVADALMSRISGKAPRLVKLGLPDVYAGVVGTQDFLRKTYGIDSASIENTVRSIYG